MKKRLILFLLVGILAFAVIALCTAPAYAENENVGMSTEATVPQETAETSADAPSAPAATEGSILLALIYLGIMLAIILVWFIVLKRPVYEGVFLSLLILLTITGRWSKLGKYITEGALTGSNASLVFSMIAFVAMSQFLKATGILDDCISCILALFGRITGGAGYATVIASSFMGAFSGSGPGNVMAVGTITIPAMKKSGFSPEIAAGVQASSSCLGNIIPPSSNIILALGAYHELYGEGSVSQGRFWLIMWGISFWFILQRFLTVFIICKVKHIKPMNKDDLPDMKTVFRNGWKGLLLPVIIVLPFILDFAFKSSFFTARLGSAGAESLSKSVLLFTAGIASFYALLVTDKKSIRKLKNIANTFTKGMKSLAPTVATVVFGYIIGALFKDIGVKDGLEALINSMGLGAFGMAVVISILTCVLGMVIPGSSLTTMFGSLFISVMAASGINPLIAAAMLPCICGAMGNITPPFALCMYASISLAESDFGKTVKNDLLWVLLQFAMQIVLLLGWLPIFGI